MPTITTGVQAYMVRWWLLDSGWIEFDDWMIAGMSAQTGVFEVWFKDVAKATYFKVSYTEDNTNI